jgi:hypothetical protein
MTRKLILAATLIHFAPLAHSFTNSLSTEMFISSAQPEAIVEAVAVASRGAPLAIEARA